MIGKNSEKFYKMSALKKSKIFSSMCPTISTILSVPKTAKILTKFQRNFFKNPKILNPKIISEKYPQSTGR